LIFGGFVVDGLCEWHPTNMWLVGYWECIALGVFSGAGIQTNAGLLAMMLSFTVIMPPVVLTLIPPSVVFLWFVLVRVVVLLGVCCGWCFCFVPNPQCLPQLTNHD
jgi:hypothetical protein